MDTKPGLNDVLFETLLELCGGEGCVVLERLLATAKRLGASEDDAWGWYYYGKKWEPSRA